MLTKDALQYLAAEMASGRLEDEGAIILPKETAICDLEKFQPGRRRFRGVFKTNSIDAFCDYVKVKADGSAAASVPCFVDPTSMEAAAIFNLGTAMAPGHGDDKAHLDMQPTAAYHEALALTKHTLGQTAFAEWLEDWSHLIEFYGSEDGILVPRVKAISAVRNITIDTTRKAEHSVEAMAKSQSAFERTEAKSRDGLPHYFVMSTPPYHGMESREIHFRLTIKTAESGVYFAPRIVGQEAMAESIARELADIIAEQFSGTTVTPLVGTFALGA